MPPINATGRTPHAYGIGAWCQAIANWGRLLMFEFGFGGLVKEIETRFGSFAATCLTLIIGLTIAVIGLNLLLTQGILPVVTSFQEMLEQQVFTFSKFWEFLRNALVLCLAVIVVASIRNAIEIRNRRNDIYFTVGEIQEVNEQFRKIVADSKERNARSKDILTKAIANSDASIARSRVSMTLTRDAKLIIRQFKEVLSVIAKFATNTQNKKVQKEIAKFFEEIDKLPAFKDEVPSRKSLPRVATKKHR